MSFTRLPCDRNILANAFDEIERGGELIHRFIQRYRSFSDDLKDIYDCADADDADAIKVAEAYCRLYFLKRLTGE